jgi:YVTN family beta-propeller protein
LKDTGKTVAFQARPPFAVLKILDTGPITNHVNFVRTTKGQFAYVTVGGLNQVQVFNTSDFSKVATIPVGRLPHGIWPSGDGSRVYVGLENADELISIDTTTNAVIATIPIGQAPQALTYVSNAVPAGPGTGGLQPLGVAGQAAHLTLDGTSSKAVTSVSLFDQGLIQVLQAAVNGLEPKTAYVLSLSTRPDGTGAIQPLAAFTTNPAGSAIVNAVGPIRQLVKPDTPAQRRFLVVMSGTPQTIGSVVQFQTP